MNKEAHKLSPQEKKSIEKIIFAEIAEAEIKVIEIADKKVEELKEQLGKNPPTKAKEFIIAYNLNIKAQAKIERELKELGFDASYDRNENGQDIYKLNVLSNAYDNYRTKPIQEIRDAEEKKKNQLKEAKKQFTLKLYVEGQEAKAVFSELAEQLKNILK